MSLEQSFISDFSEYSHWKPAIYTFVYGLDIIDQLHMRVS